MVSQIGYDITKNQFGPCRASLSFLAFPGKRENQSGNISKTDGRLTAVEFVGACFSSIFPDVIPNRLLPHCLHPSWLSVVGISS